MIFCCVHRSRDSKLFSVLDKLGRPQKLPLPLLDLDPHVKRDSVVPWARIRLPKRHLGRFSRFLQG